MTRLLSVIHYPVFGGPHNQAMVLAPLLERRGLRTMVFLPDDPGNALGRLRSAGIDVVTAPLHRLRASPNPAVQLTFARAFRREVEAIRLLIREHAIDLVQVNGLNPHGGLAARAEGVPVVWQLVDTRPPPFLRRVLMTLATRLADTMMSTGWAVAGAHPGAARLGDRLHVYYPPVDPLRFRPGAVEREPARAAFGFAPDDIVVGSVGNLNPQKGHEHLILAFAEVRAGRPNVKLLLVGAAHETHQTYQRHLRRLVAERGLEAGRDVIFAGALDDVRPALAAMDAFALASVRNSEGAPTVLLEAMMFELPVVATDAGAIREVVEDSVTGFVVPAPDAAGLAGSLGRLLADEALRASMGRAGRERAAERFSLDRCVEAHVAAYDTALRRRGRPGLPADPWLLDTPPRAQEEAA